MIKISKEFKAGIATIVILGLFYWGFSYLKGRNLLRGGLNSYYTTYQNINGLRKSSAVTVNGFTVGSVIDIYFSQDPAQKGELIVEFTIEEDFKFSKNSIAKIYSAGLMGGKSLAIVPADDDSELAKPGDYLKGDVESDMLSSFTNKLNPLQSKIENAITNIDSVAHDVNVLLSDDMIGNLQSSIENINQILATLNNTSKTIDNVIAKNETNLDATLKSMSATTKNLKVFSDSLAQVKILSISKKINNTAASLDSITAGIQAGNGTLGKLTKDEKLYNNLEQASKELEELLRDMKEHPKRFVHFSLFGKKAKPYKETTDK
ncbi:phospholipid/cholesterol/gamma-HCH transport system substrate-binding protein [Wenyingzhuangia heitensis]|uniref:Phospholipid/cholesterol/gamma-HCH transport system substrate-binding protein n=1 Tax=Wenyingzhuangia heitensis TaxID=1487859 RepID=A0ABX0UGY5_9FLAO|nr:MlaD family protein [Wenyingzhuangia heitensis]NIJ46277.1 phospholipid/cholesterol/gamma-HCH transport system substrate-binding protein [Wenyingzhuangia heitensis]